jgi:hypothetical protein
LSFKSGCVEVADEEHDGGELAEDESKYVSFTRASFSIRALNSRRNSGSRSPIVFCALTVPPNCFTRRPETTFHDDDDTSSLCTFESNARSSSSAMKFSIREMSFRFASFSFAFRVDALVIFYLFSFQSLFFCFFSFVVVVVVVVVVVIIITITISPSLPFSFSFSLFACACARA